MNSKMLLFLSVVVNPVFSIAQNMMLPYLSEGKYGVVEENGQVIIEPKYDAVLTKEGIDIILVRQNGLWGVINNKDEIFLPMIIEDDQPARLGGMNIHGPEMKRVFIGNNYNNVKYQPFRDTHLYEIHDAAREVSYYINPFAPQTHYIAFPSLNKSNPNASILSYPQCTGIVKVTTASGKLNFIDTSGQLILKESVREGEVVSPFVLAVQNEDKLYALFDIRGNAITSFSFSNVSKTMNFEFITAVEKSMENRAKPTYSLFDQHGKQLVADHPKKITIEGNRAIIRYDDKAQLMDITGKIVFENTEGAISSAFPRSDVFLFCQNDLNGFISENGKVVLPAEYDLLEPTLYGDWLFKKGEKFGVLDSLFQEKWTIDSSELEPDWSYDAGFILVEKKSGNEIKVGLLDTLGNILLDPIYSSIEADDGKGPIIAQLDSMNMLIDSHGKIIIPMTDSLIYVIYYPKLVEYPVPSDIYYNLRDSTRMHFLQRPPVKVVYTNGKAYLADLSGNPINQVTYDVLRDVPGIEVNRALFIAYRENSPGKELINENGKSILPEGYQLTPYEEDHTVGGLVKVFYQPNDQLIQNYFSDDPNITGIIDADGNWVLPPDSTKKTILAKEFIQAQVSGELEFNLYTREGYLVDGGPFSYVPFFLRSEGILHDRLVVGRPKKWKAYERKMMKYEEAGTNNIFEKSNSMQLKGCIDHTGQVKVPLQYEFINEFSYPYTTVYGKTKSGKKFTAIIDLDGNEMIRTDYENLRILSGDSSMVSFEKNGKTGLMNVNGQIIIPPKYTFIEKDKDALKYILLDSVSTFVADLNDPEQPIRIGPKGELVFGTGWYSKKDGLVYATLNPRLDGKEYYCTFDASGKLLSSFEGFDLIPSFMNSRLPDPFMSIRDSKESPPYIVNVRSGKAYKSND